VPFLKVFLGLVLIAAASKGFWDHRHG